MAFDNFPFEFNATLNWLKTTDNGGEVTSQTGADIRFESVGQVQLPRDLSAYVPAAGSVRVTFKFDVLNQNGTSAFAIFTGKDGADEQDAAGCWSEHELVIDCSDGSGRKNDSYDMTATTITSSTMPDGRPAGDLNGTSSKLEDADGNPLNGASAFTITIWEEPDDASNNDLIWMFGAWTGGIYLRHDSAGSQGGGTDLFKFGFQNAYYESASNVQSTAAQRLDVTWSSGNAPKFYINGDLVAWAVTGGTKTGPLTMSAPILLGDPDGNSWMDWFDGKLADFRVRLEEISASQIKAEYTNQTTQTDGTMWSVGEEGGTAPTIVDDPTVTPPDPPDPPPTGDEWDDPENDLTLWTPPPHDFSEQLPAGCTEAQLRSALLTAMGRTSGTVSRVVLPASETIEVAGNIDLNAATGAVLLVDFNGSTIEHTNVSSRIAIEGAWGTIRNIDGVALNGGNTEITFNSAWTPDFVKDDVIKIFSYSASFPYGRTTSRKMGQIMRVLTVSGQVVTVQGELWQHWRYSTNVRAAEMLCADKCIWFYDSTAPGGSTCKVINNDTSAGTTDSYRLILKRLRRPQIYGLYLRNDHGTPSTWQYRRPTMWIENCFRSRIMDPDIRNSSNFNERYGILDSRGGLNMAARSTSSTKGANDPDFKYCRHAVDNGTDNPSNSTDIDRHGFTYGLRKIGFVIDTCHNIAHAEHAGSVRGYGKDITVLNAKSGVYQFQTRGVEGTHINYVADSGNPRMIQNYNEPNSSQYKNDDSDNCFDHWFIGGAWYSLPAYGPIGWSEPPVGPHGWRDADWHVSRSINIGGRRTVTFENTDDSGTIYLEGTENTIFNVDGNTTLVCTGYRIDASGSSLSNGSTVYIANVASGSEAEGTVEIVSNPNNYSFVAGSGTNTISIS
jgi:hypothetical protein